MKLKGRHRTHYQKAVAEYNKFYEGWKWVWLGNSIIIYSCPHDSEKHQPNPYMYYI